ncbi:hypothetical protein SAMN05216428_102371 [Nitrosospira sp. Nsp11]|uniref:hypothetical protein n=1 Tax=Nitrosospira sp. Nsp11 TaxID=1855338 RepID=UPI0009217A99|nr:hypothetical protein [Nitrosospira sp. Nsp11]SHL42711.1 hypothetical protein SAMN05216428_102371 [Nitrosospira sp. Nsp11]
MPATYSAVDLNTKARHMGGYGNAVIHHGSVTPTTGAVGDVYRPVRIPAGTLLTDLSFVTGDLDTGTGTISAKVGYAPVDSDGPAAVDDYFAATATTLLAAAGRKEMSFQPIKFEKDVFITVTLTIAANAFAAVAVTAIAKGIGEGVK